MANPLSQDEFNQRYNRDMELARRELERRKHDLILVYNPLETTFSFMYDRYWHRVPAKSTKVLERYLARQFFRKIAEYMIGQQIMLKGKELLDLRVKQLGQQILDKYEENVQIWDKTPKLNDPDLLAQIRKVVLVRVVEEYGMDIPQEEPREPEAPQNYSPVSDQIFDTIDEQPSAEPEVTKAEDIKTEGMKPIDELLENPKEDTPAVYVSKKDRQKMAKEVTNEA